MLFRSVRERTDALDSLGNTTAATGKGFAIGSAALTALALIASYIDRVAQLKPDLQLDLSVTNPLVLVGLFIGGMLPFLFAALTMSAVGTAAQSIVSKKVVSHTETSAGQWKTISTVTYVPTGYEEEEDLICTASFWRGKKQESSVELPVKSEYVKEQCDAVMVHCITEG